MIAKGEPRLRIRGTVTTNYSFSNLIYHILPWKVLSKREKGERKGKTSYKPHKL